MAGLETLKEAQRQVWVFQQWMESEEPGVSDLEFQALSKQQQLLQKVEGRRRDHEKFFQQSVQGKKAVLEIYRDLDEQKRLQVQGRPQDISQVYAATEQQTKAQLETSEQVASHQNQKQLQAEEDELKKLEMQASLLKEERREVEAELRALAFFSTLEPSTDLYSSAEVVSQLAKYFQ